MPAPELSIVEGGYTGTANQQSCGAVPSCFVDADGADGTFGTSDDDLHLVAGCTAIDSGSNAAAPLGLDKDLDGKPRYSDDPATPNAGAGTPPVIDLGPYEYQPAQ